MKEDKINLVKMINELKVDLEKASKKEVENTKIINTNNDRLQIFNSFIKYQGFKNLFREYQQITRQK